MPHLTRRTLLAAGLAGPALSCAPAFAATRGVAHGAFTHGVASGDPLKDAVILWTRFVTADAGPGEIGWEVAEDDSFKSIVRSGKAAVSPRRDFCVKVDARGLKPGRSYAYRFVGAKGPSVTGLTRTAPDAGAASLRFALLSCANLGFGWFHAYRDAAARPDIELCIHVGDYFYEYGRGAYPSAKEAVAGRILMPEVELISSSDYHRRYANYRDDPDLQELHRIKPWIAIWDDHEFANDTWSGGAQNHDPATEGAWQTRRANAVQAYLDWMPVRHDPRQGLAIYRRYDWGGLATLLMLDTRMIGRSRAMSYQELFGDVPDMDETKLAAAVDAFKRKAYIDPKRTMMGFPQEAWLRKELQRSRAAGTPWQVMAQQVVMGDVVTPQAFNRFVPADATERTKTYTLSGTRLAKYGLPYTLDAWGGYPAARARLMADIQAHAANTIVLSGDSHSAWANNLAAAADGPCLAVEVAATAVTSPGMEKWLTAAPAGGREDALTGENPGIAWCDATNKGYAIVTLTRENATADFVALGDVADPAAGVIGNSRMVAEATGAGPRPWLLS